MTAPVISRVFVHGVGVAAPGLGDWAAALPVLRGESEYRAEPLPAFRTSLLPRNESRRAGAGVRLAFRVAEQACSPEQAGTCATVFASSAGDIDIAEALCSAVNTPERAVSPTRFHNSVHNAAAGYWSIASGSREPSNSLSGGMDGFAVALCEAWATLATRRTPVLLVCFDCDGQGLLHDARPDIHGSFGLALLLSREESGALARISRPVLTRDAATRCADEQLEYFRRCNPSARALPLLTALAGRRAVAGRRRVGPGQSCGRGLLKRMTRTEILERIPHAGAMCLLDEVLVWDASHILCRSRSHRGAHHPLRHDGRIAPVHLVEYGAQAVAVHGALSAHDRDHAALEDGRLAAVRDVTFGTMDNVADIQAPLEIRADCELASASGLIYRFTVAVEQICLASGRLTIVGR